MRLLRSKTSHKTDNRFDGGCKVKILTLSHKCNEVKRMEYQSGQMVFSKSGHDKGDILVVLYEEGAYVYMADGKRRKLEKPKRKKKIHVQPTGYVDAALAERLTVGAYLLDADIAKAIRTYREVSANKV